MARVVTSAPSRSARASAARASSTVAPSNPWSSGRRAPRSSSAARISAASIVSRLPSMVAGGASAGGRNRSENQRAPSGHSRPQPDLVARRLDDHVVAQQTTSGAGDRAEFSHRSAPHRRARTRAEHRARRARATPLPSETSVHTGAPRLIVSPACGTSRTSPSGHQPGSGARRSRSANSTSFTFAHRVARGSVAVGTATFRTPRTCASKHPGPNSSSEPGGRGLTSSTHAQRPSQIASTPNAPRTPKRRRPRRRRRAADRRARRVLASGSRGGVTLPIHPKPGRRCSCSVRPSTAARRPSPIATAEHDSPSIRRWRISVGRRRPPAHPRTPRPPPPSAAFATTRHHRSAGETREARRPNASLGRARRPRAPRRPDRPWVAHGRQQVRRASPATRVRRASSATNSG